MKEVHFGTVGRYVGHDLQPVRPLPSAIFSHTVAAVCEQNDSTATVSKNSVSVLLCIVLQPCVKCDDKKQRVCCIMT